MEKQEELESALARAETGLGRAITEGALPDANEADSSANVEKARAHCRQTRAALNLHLRSKR